MNRRDFFWIFFVFLFWRFFLLVASIVGTIALENQLNFLGGGLEQYLQNPIFWGWANFDGEHYLTIASRGYADLLYFYFPLYPLLVNFLGGSSLVSLQQTALIISNASFFMALIGLWKLINLDFKKRTAKLVLLCLLSFPTSFYFAASYTESLFLFTVVWTFYFARMRLYPQAALLGTLSSATRIIGMGLIPSLLIEEYYLKKSKSVGRALLILLCSSGFLIYVYYLWNKTGDPLAFNAGSELFGEYRSQTPLFLPQILYRYVFKIVPNLAWGYFPVVYTTLLEFAVGLVLTLVSILGFFKLRTSYWVYLIAGFMMPSMYNGFVSLPRYAVVLFPLFILLAYFIKDKNNFIKTSYFLISTTLLFLGTMLFIRGFWVG